MGAASVADGGAVKNEGAVEDEDADNWSPRTGAIAARTTSRPAIRIQRIRIGRVVDRARWR
jgi:hypothetical protein